jgi:hypothetical protein
MSERDSSPPEAAPATSPSKRGGGRGGFTLSLKGRALRLLTGREHSRAELERKLAPHEEEAGQLAKVLDDLQAKDFISEPRVIEAMAAGIWAARTDVKHQSATVAVEAFRELPGTQRGKWIAKAARQRATTRASQQRCAARCSSLPWRRARHAAAAARCVSHATQARRDAWPTRPEQP